MKPGEIRAVFIVAEYAEQCKKMCNGGLTTWMES